jgi:hypothetical protein
MALPPEDLGTLEQLDEDCVLAVLCAMAGDPPEQARSLARLSRASKKCHAAVKSAACLLVAEHMRTAHHELDELKSAYAAWARTTAAWPPTLHLDLTLPVDALASPLRALAMTLPILPLQSSALRDGMLQWSRSDRAASAPFELGMTSTFAHLHATHDAVPFRLLANDERQAPFLAFAAAAAVGLAHHPGLVDRWRPEARRAAVCSSCHRWRRHPPTRHVTWTPDALDDLTLPLPPEMATKAQQERRWAVDSARRRRSSRDEEEFSEADLVDMAEHAALAQALKCDCSAW